MRRKLLQRGHAEQAVEAVLDVIAGQGLQSDDRFSETYLNERMRKGFGPLRIRAELRERGIEESLIALYLDSIDETDWMERLASVHNKKFGMAPAQGRSELARRGRFLEYRGFSSSQVSRFLRFDS